MLFPVLYFAVSGALELVNDGQMVFVFIAAMWFMQESKGLLLSLLTTVPAPSSTNSEQYVHVRLIYSTGGGKYTATRMQPYLI